MAPSLNKPRITNCDNAVGATKLTDGYKPGICWCDAACKSAGDCCPVCNNCTASDAPAAPPRSDHGRRRSKHSNNELVTADSVVPLSYAQAMAQHAQHSDCGIVGQRLKLKAAMATIASAAPANWETDAEEVMQKCQAADTGAPAKPYLIAVHWTAAEVCSGSCSGGDYSTDVVNKQMDYLNAVYKRVGIQFTWDGVIHKAQASSMDQIGDYSWVCNLQRYGEGLTIHVVTAPEHL